MSTQTMADNSIKGIFGVIKPPPGSNFASLDPVGALSNLIVNGIRLFLLAAGILMLIYLLWGGLDWILSGGDKERLQKARQKLTNAVVGMFVIVAALTIFGVVTGDILGIIKQTPSGWRFELPTFRGPAPAEPDAPCVPGKPCAR
jgi:hypothetical protein